MINVEEQQQQQKKNDTYIPVLIAALFTIVNTWKQAKYQKTEEWIKKMWSMYAMEYYPAIKRNGIG